MHTIVVLIVNAFSPAAGVRVEGEVTGSGVEDGGRLEAKDQAERWTGGGPWPGKVRLCGKSKAVEWSGGGAMRCGYAPVRTNANAALRCARGREACRGQLGKLEFGRLKAASDARLPWEA